MNKQSNTYTIIYIIVLVAVVGAALALTSMALKDRQQDNVNADRMRQILASVKITPAQGEIISDFRRYIVDTPVYNSRGEKVGDDAFGVSVSEQSKITDPAERLLPLYVCRLADGELKYIIPVYGSGLWGPIWGYLALDSDGSTVYGAYFDHQGETPGLGAEITKPAFQDQFDSSLHFFKDGKFIPVEVVKKGQRPLDGADYVDGVSGGTITSKGVSAMIDNCVSPYKNILLTLQDK